MTPQSQPIQHQSAGNMARLTTDDFDRDLLSYNTTDDFDRIPPNMPEGEVPNPPESDNEDDEDEHDNDEEDNLDKLRDSKNSEEEYSVEEIDPDEDTVTELEQRRERYYIQRMQDERR